MKTKPLITPDFLLHSETARIFYNNYVKDLPIIDYHNHLPPQEIANNKSFSNMTELWLKGDHYKWRAMRALGVNEELITGKATDEEKFMKWGEAVPQLLRNPLFHWTQMELKNPFGIEDYLNGSSAKSIYAACNEKLSLDRFRTQGLLKHFGVETLCTTDDPADSLDHHQQLRNQNFGVRVLPTFRPDRIFNFSDGKTFREYLGRLSDTSGITIVDLDSLLEALRKRVDFFHLQGCRLSDHGLVEMPLPVKYSSALNENFSKYLKDPRLQNPEWAEEFTGFVLIELSKLYHQKSWVQQFHIGAIRNNNSRMFNRLGPDAGTDSIGDQQHASRLALFLNHLDQSGQLAKTILYNINPSDNEVFATMAGNFNDGRVRGNIQYGSAWWFLDQLDGIQKQINVLSNLGVISTFVGMTTDSRSFLSYSRHEYFRRIICDLFASDIESGLLPRDEKWIGEILQKICYHNAKDYFNFG